MNDRKEYSFASVSFANSVPFTDCLESVCPTCKVLYDPPSKLSDMLLSGAVDSALVPVADLFADSILTPIGNIGICATGKTTSTLLKCSKPLENVSSVLKDPSSKTSNALAEVLFRNHFNVSVEMLEHTAGLEADAHIVIGDRALKSEAAACCEYDLSEEWLSMTGKPFVFAVWAVKEDCSYSDDLAEILNASLDKGIENVENIAKSQAVRLDLPYVQCLEYLSNIIRYRLEKDDLEGMNLFREMFNDLRSEV